MLNVKDINVYYGAIHAVRNVSLEVNAGEIVSIIGANGAGKSTLLTALAGIGTADVEGSIILSPPDAAVGYLAQEPDRIEGETVLEFLGRRTGVAHAEEVMNAAAETLAEACRQHGVKLNAQ